VLFGDTFPNIQRSLLPVNLYMLSLTCKQYHKIITKDNIKKSIICEINRRLNSIFDDKYVEFMRLLNDANATIMGSFITQCMLGESWEDTQIHIVIKKAEINVSIVGATKTYRQNWDNTMVFLHKYRMNPQAIMDPNKGTHFMQYNINGILIKLFLVHDDYTYNINIKNIYNIATNRLIINNTHDTFTKRINLYRDNGDMMDPATFFKMYLRGFRFYRDNMMMSNEAIHNLIYKTIKIKGKRKREECESHVNRGKFMIKNGIIYSWTPTENRERYKPYPVFDIDTKSPYYTIVTDSKLPQCHVQISKCINHDCITKLLYPKLEHYHCTCAREKKFILIPKYS